MTTCHICQKEVWKYYDTCRDCELMQLKSPKDNVINLPQAKDTNENI